MPWVSSVESSRTWISRRSRGYAMLAHLSNEQAGGYAARWTRHEGPKRGEILLLAGAGSGDAGFPAGRGGSEELGVGGVGLAAQALADQLHVRSRKIEEIPLQRHVVGVGALHFLERPLRGERLVAQRLLAQPPLGEPEARVVMGV